MEFHEKLQALRKSRGLTQEELAEALFVSRTAVSKWESGRGYPGIDSLKAISRYFSVTIDDLLSGEKLLQIAEKEKQSSMQHLCDLLFGMADLLSLLLIVLPLYPNLIDGRVYSVNLFAYTAAAASHRVVYWFLFLALTGSGAAKLLFAHLKMERCCRAVTRISIGISIAGVLLLAMAREAYAVTVIFLLLVVKGMLIGGLFPR